MRDLRARGLTGAALCVSDDHIGLRNAIARVFGCRWQRCSVHFLRNMLGHCKKDHRPLVAAALRQIFAVESGEVARQRLGEVTAKLETIEPKDAKLLLSSEADLLAFYEFPKSTGSSCRSTNPLERVNREIGRRTDIVRIFTNDASLIRLAGSVLIEQQRRVTRMPPLHVR